MIWTESYSSYVTNKTEYFKCKKCGKYPAICIEEEVFESHEGPFCELHWHENVNYQFDLLRRKLDDEDWGSSPETRHEVCHMCKKISDRIKILSYRGKPVDSCCDCYDKYSTK